MITVRRALAAVVVVLGAAGLTACTTGQPEPEDSLDTAARSEVSATGSAPIVFAFVCSGAADGSTDSGDEPSDDPDGTAETYTTYAAVWEAERADCRAERITGTEMSAQQRAAVRATDGAATLEELAATCAERGASPWRDGVSTPEQADLAAGLVAYCPGHPDRDRLQEALTAYRG
ncbi:hypothetical protein [Curtobacterium oceanosedimentum]|uniref:DUF732 domain-containing protein n=1 Tax=Curtobacterium oceanosedimentum TaxID=465820 RepID=A0A147DTL4_9MICO|nr:hypothetical protein [Curtobacterium oceanosedimentum]KTR53276.1 hypothetical protein NS359_03890 [Curtobacterium oceanosedimentum]